MRRTAATPEGHGPGCRAGSRPEAGFSLLEAIVATVIAIVAVVGLAYAFSTGRSFINAFEYRRVADAQAAGTMEWLGSLPATDPALAVGGHGPQPFQVDGNTVGQVTWTVGTASDAPASVVALLHDVRVTVSWTFGGFADSVAYVRTVVAP